MTDSLIIRLLNDDHAEWSLWRADQKLAESEAPILISELPALYEHKIIVLVPGAQVLLTSIEVPAKQRRHLKRVLPFLVEEQLAEDVALLHLATSSEKNKSEPILVAAVKKALMENWLDKLANAGLSPHIMIPETLAIPYRAPAWTLLYDGITAWLRTSPSQSYAIEAEAFPNMLDLLIKQTPEPVIMECHLAGVVSKSDATKQLIQIQEKYGQISWKVEHISSPMDIFSKEISAPTSATLNLMQGEFPPRAQKNAGTNSWKKLVSIAALWFIAQIILDGGQAAYFSYKAASFRDQSIELYKRLFPADNKIIDPVSQMKNHIVRSAQGNEAGFLSLLQKITAHGVMQESGSIAIQNISYRGDNNILTLNVSAKSIEDINKFAQQLNSGDINSKILSIANDKDVVKAQVTVKDTDNEK